MEPDGRIETKEEFIEFYTKGRGLTYQQLQERGREALPCDCDDMGCRGWQMAYEGVDVVTKIVVDVDADGDAAALEVTHDKRTGKTDVRGGKLDG